jgi:hypothetical protein
MRVQYYDITRHMSRNPQLLTDRKSSNGNGRNGSLRTGSQSGVAELGQTRADYENIVQSLRQTQHRFFEQSRRTVGAGLFCTGVVSPGFAVKDMNATTASRT